MGRRRKRGSGGLHRLPSGSWHGQVRLPGGVRRGFTARDKGAVEFWLREATRATRAGEDPADIRTTLADYLDDWLADTARTVRHSTLRGYRIHVNLWIAPIIGRERLPDLMPHHVRRVRDGVLEAGRSPRTSAAVLRTLRTALAQAVRDGIMARNVADGVRPPHQPARKVVATDPVEARAILAAFADHRLGPLVSVAIGTGLRLGELLGLRWEDVGSDRLWVRGAVRPGPRPDGTGYELAWTATKTTRSVRVIEPPPFVLAALEEQRRRQVVSGLLGPFVFTTEGRRDRAGQAVFLDPKNVTLSFKAHLAASGFPRMRFHDLRHAYATLMLASGVPLRVISESLGHTQITTTAGVYAHVLPSLRREAADKLQAVLVGDKHTS